MFIYADNAATTKLRRAARDAMLPYLDELYGNPSSLHRMGQKAGAALFDAREKMAAALGCKPSELTFTSGGSESDNQALLSAAKLGEKQGKRHIVSTAVEHHAVLRALRRLEAEGFDVTLLPVEPETGLVTPEQVADAIRADTALVSVMYANNEIGTIEPVREIGEVCREKGVLFHTDAVQAVGHLPIDLAAEQIDLLSLSAHKFGGPKGTGALYARKGVALTSLIEGGAQERGKRAGTENVAGVVGMAAALEEAAAALDADAARLIPLRDKLIAGLRDIPRGMLNGDETRRLPGNVSFCFEGVDGESLLLLLDGKGVCASSRSACTAGSLDPSHVLLAIGRSHAEALGSLRLSLGADTTEEEVGCLIEAVTDAVARLRGK
ncbi:MAG: cysteine desulfurase [Oscillospiraceae bacterium]|nr:cysteine desulfurase [Oscillospiraceae bacterium]